MRRVPALLNPSLSSNPKYRCPVKPMIRPACLAYSLDLTGPHLLLSPSPAVQAQREPQVPHALRGSGGDAPHVGAE